MNNIYVKTSNLKRHLCIIFLINKQKWWMILKGKEANI